MRAGEAGGRPASCGVYMLLAGPPPAPRVHVPTTVGVRTLRDGATDQARGIGRRAGGGRVVEIGGGGGLAAQASFHDELAF